MGKVSKTFCDVLYLCHFTQITNFIGFIKYFLEYLLLNICKDSNNGLLYKYLLTFSNKLTNVKKELINILKKSYLKWRR